MKRLIILTSLSTCGNTVYAMDEMKCTTVCKLQIPKTKIQIITNEFKRSCHSHNIALAKRCAENLCPKGSSPNKTKCFHEIKGKKIPVYIGNKNQSRFISNYSSRKY